MNVRNAMRAALSFAFLLPATGALGASELEEIRATQKQILERLKVQDKILKRILNQPKGTARAARGAQPDLAKVYEIPVARSVVKGPKNAKVTMVEFSDFQCPFCARTTPLIAELLKAYPKDLRFVYKQMPLTQIHKEAMPAAKASIAAGKQGKFWEMHDALFENSRGLSSGKYKELAEKLELDVAKFLKDMESKEVEAEVKADMALASRVGVRGTPTFFIQGKRVSNRSVESMKAMVDEALSDKGNAGNN